MSFERFSRQLEYGYGTLQIYFKKDCQTMAIQECYGFNGFGVTIFCPVSSENFSLAYVLFYL